MSRLLLLIGIVLFSQFSHALELSPLSNKPYMGDLDVLKTKGTVRVLVSADLGFYYIEDGKPKGIVAEMLYHFEKAFARNTLTSMFKSSLYSEMICFPLYSLVMVMSP